MTTEAHDPEIQTGHRAEQSFDSRALVRSAETSSLALAEQAKAAVQARYIMAMQRPRSIVAARQKLLEECKRPRFAEAAIYNKPVGEGITGPSIRMAEAAARALGNIYAEVSAIYDDNEKRIIRVSVTDLEANLTFPKDVTIEKTIERSKPLPGRKIISTRKNSKGYDVFLIEATSDEILDKENALASKAMRVCLLRVVPGDLLDEALDQCFRTRDGEISQDLPGSRKRMADQFAALGITVEQLAEYLGHPVDTATLEEMSKAKGVLSALKDKETTWAEVMEFARQSGSATEATGAHASGSLKDKLDAKAANVNGKEPTKTVDAAP